MKSKLFNSLLIAFLLLVAFACKRDELDFDKIAKRIQNERTFSGPLVLGNLSLREIVEKNEDSTLVINGDTVSLVIRKDSIVNFVVSDFANFPEQDSSLYISISGNDLPVGGQTIIDTSALEIDTIHAIVLENSMRIDSAYLQTGQLSISAENTFNHTLDLIISSSSLTDENGNPLSHTIYNIGSGELRHELVNIDNYTLISESGGIHINFHPILYVNPAYSVVSSSNSLHIYFGVKNLNDFDAVFGFFGYQTESYDTSITDLLPEMLDGLEGTFSATNPKIRFIYDQSFGLGAEFDLLMEAHYSDKAPATIDPPVGVIDYSSDFLNPEYHGKITWDRNTVPNIDELISFPFSDSLRLNGALESNVGKDSLTHSNYALWESSLNLGLEIEIPLEFSADLAYTDTIPFEGVGEENSIVEVEKADLVYWFLNSFPLGFNADLILHDSISGQNLGVIQLNSDPTIMFLKPAPVDAQGNVEKARVTRQEGRVELDKTTAELLLNETTHLIVQAILITTDASSARVGADAELQFQFSLDAQLTYTSY